jgi:hypothetical protein
MSKQCIENHRKKKYLYVATSSLPPPSSLHFKHKPETKTGKPTFKKAVREALKRVRTLGEPVMKLPIPIESTRTIHIGPIVIICNGTFNICIVLDFPDKDMVCMICLFDRPICGGPMEQL